MGQEQTTGSGQGQPAASTPAPAAVQPKSPELPKGNFFDGGNMSKWAHEAGLFEAEPVKPQSGEAKPEGAPADQKTAEGRTPITVLKVNGKDVPVYTQEELTKYAQQGYDYTQKRQRDSEWERALEEREQKLSGVSETLDQIVARMKSGKPLFQAPETETEEKDEDPFGTDEDEIDDPVAKAKLAEANERIKKLESKLGVIDEDRNRAVQAEIAERLENFYLDAKKEHPIQEVVDEETKTNLTDELVAGYTTVLQKKEELRARVDKGYKPRMIPELIREAARNIQRFQSAVQGAGAGTAAPADLTAEVLRTSNPSLVEAIERQAVEAFLAERSGRPPIVKPRSGEAGGKAAQGKREILNLDDALAQGLDDPEVDQAIQQMGREAVNFAKYGLK